MKTACGHNTQKTDYFFWCCMLIVFSAYLFAAQSQVSVAINWLNALSQAIFDMINQIWWGILFGFVMLLLLSFVPKELVIRLFGRKNNLNSLVRAAIAGVLLDLCSHGILMIAAKLYERGVSIGQIMAFLIASPWNSFSLTLILFALIGIKWTLVIILISLIIGLITGAIFNVLVSRKVLPDNPNRIDIAPTSSFMSSLHQHIKSASWDSATVSQVIQRSWHEAQMVIRWLLFGVIAASLIKVFVHAEWLHAYFGPTLMGLGLTVVAATIIEVCSEGSAPIAADLFTRAKAPGNGFAFLMTGVSTDYTEMMILKDTTRSWKIALFLPLVTLPQIIVVAWIINQTV